MSAHKSHIAINNIRDLWFELVDYPPCSPGLGMSDYYIFPKLKNSLEGHNFSANKEGMETKKLCNRPGPLFKKDFIKEGLCLVNLILSIPPRIKGYIIKVRINFCEMYSK